MYQWIFLNAEKEIHPHQTPEHALCWIHWPVLVLVQSIGEYFSMQTKKSIHTICQSTHSTEDIIRVQPKNRQLHTAWWEDWQNMVGNIKFWCGVKLKKKKSLSKLSVQAVSILTAMEWRKCKGTKLRGLSSNDLVETIKYMSVRC